MKSAATQAFLAALIGAAGNAAAHHSYSEYDDTRTVDIEGTLTEVAWQNPHARILVRASDATGAAVTYEIESAGLNNFRRMNVLRTSTTPMQTPRRCSAISLGH